MGRSRLNSRLTTTADTADAAREDRENNNLAVDDSMYPLATIR